MNIGGPRYSEDPRLLGGNSKATPEEKERFSRDLAQIIEWIRKNRK